MEHKFPRLCPKSSYIERWHGLTSIPRAGQVSFPGTGSRSVLMQRLLGNWNPSLWEEMSQQLPETKIVVSSQDPMACSFQTYPSLFLSREALLSVARKQFLELPCPCVCWYVSCGSQTCEGLDCCDEKGWWSSPAFIFWEWFILELPKWGRNGDWIKRALWVLLIFLWFWWK